MPLTVPAGLLTKANFVLAYLKPLVDATETNADTALTTAQAANTLAGQKYTKPAGGIPASDLDAATQTAVAGVRAGLRFEYLWNGTAYVDPAGGAIPTRPAGTLRGFTGPANPNALGLMVDGDRWTDTSA